MSTELIINSSPSGRRIALMKDRQLVEFHTEDNRNDFNVGDIYLGTVGKVVPGLNAAFIDLGYTKDAFLHYHDLGPQIRSLNKLIKLILGKKGVSFKLAGFKLEPDTDKRGKINQILTKGQKVLVQIVKEPISSKGPRLSTQISLAGRYLVLVPFSNSVMVTKKLRDTSERKRLSKLINSVKPENFGVIVRTAAIGKDVAELDRDLKGLVKKWEDGMYALRKANPRDKIIGELNRASSLLRDMLNESFDGVITDDKDSYNEIKSFIQQIAPERENIVKFYNGKAKVFENYGVEKQIKSLFGQSVSLPNGGYLIIEHTEALHVIDVNSGNTSSSEKNQEATAIKVNLEAIDEIARQLRLRDIGGIIVVDFIDMKNPANKQQVYKKMVDILKTDKTKSVTLPLTKFGLMQITRQRVRPEMNISTSEACPSCNGTGKITASILTSDIIETQLESIIAAGHKSITIALHPFLHAYFTSGLFSKRFKWWMKYKKWINLEKDTSLAIVEFQFLDKYGEEIKNEQQKEEEEPKSIKRNDRKNAA